MLDVGRLVSVMRESGFERAFVGVRLRIIPTDPFFPAKHGVTVVEKLAVGQVRYSNIRNSRPLCSTTLPRTKAVVALWV